VLLALGCWIECRRDGGPHERLERTRLRHAEGARRRSCWTAWGAVALPEPLARRWNGPYLRRNDWETMAGLSNFVGDDITIVSRGSDGEVRMRLRWRPQTRHGQLRPPRLGPPSLN
jgi:hypothetical protein